MTINSAPQTRSRHWGYLAAAWCVLFAAVHLFWALGGELGLATSAGIDLATRRPVWFVVVGLWGVAVLVLAGAVFSIGLTRWHCAGMLRRVVLAVGWLAGGLLLVRGVLLEVVLATGAGGVSEAVGGAQTQWSLLVWNPWFVLGGAAVLLATYQFARSPRLTMA